MSSAIEAVGSLVKFDSSRLPWFLRYGWQRDTLTHPTQTTLLTFKRMPKPVHQPVAVHKKHD